jgi:hypothetical protein
VGFNKSLISASAWWLVLGLLNPQIAASSPAIIHILFMATPSLGFNLALPENGSFFSAEFHPIFSKKQTVFFNSTSSTFAPRRRD